MKKDELNVFLFYDNKQCVYFEKINKCDAIELNFYSVFLCNIDVAFQILLYFCATIKVMYVGYKNESRRLL